MENREPDARGDLGADVTGAMELAEEQETMGEKMESGPMLPVERLEKMSLESLLYYVLVGDGRRMKAESSL